MTSRERAKHVYYAGDGTLRVPCDRCIIPHGFVGYSRYEAAKLVTAGKACQ